MNRRDFLKRSLAAAAFLPMAELLAGIVGNRKKREPATVYFTSRISPEAVIRMERALGIALPGKVAVKVHSGEKGNQNFLRPEFLRPMVEAVKGTDVKDYFFLRNFISGFIGNADRLNKPQIFFTVILNRFDKHNTLRKIPSYLPIYYII